MKQIIRNYQKLSEISIYLGLNLAWLTSLNTSAYESTVVHLVMSVLNDL